MAFDLNRIQSVDFGVCVDTAGGESYRLLPSEQGVQDALKEMLVETMVALTKEGPSIEEFSPAEKYGATERLRLSLSSQLAHKHREIFAAENLPTDTHGLDNPVLLVSYFSVFRDATGTKVMAFRRAAQFKGVVKKHLITFANDALCMVADRLFKLDTDFDYLVFEDEILIWRPSGFVFTADMVAHVAACAVANVSQISEAVTCVDFTGLQRFVSKHKMAMRLVAAIRSRGDLAALSVKRLKQSCKANGVEFAVENGKLVPAEGCEMDFLLLLDRRLYTLVLIERQPETYQAASRSAVKRTLPG